jgi:amino acid transporter
MKAAAPGSAGPPGLRRSLSLPLITFYGLGNILGAGIYVLIGKVVGYAGIFAPLSFLLAALLASLTAFSYAELSARFPVSAGEAVYVERGLGLPFLAVVVGLLIVTAGLVSAATVLRGFVGYLQVLVPVGHALVLPLLVAGLAGLAAWGITQSVAVASSLTLLEIGGLALVIAVGVPSLSGLGQLHVDAAQLTTPGVGSGILIGAFLAFYAFIGFEDMVNVAEEVRDPGRNMPRAILWAVGVSTSLYLAVAWVAIASVPAAELAASTAPLALIYASLTGREPLLITVIGMIAVVNGALIQMIMASRVLYGMAGRGWLPRVLARIHPRTRTPLFATALVGGMVLVLALTGTTENLAKATSFALLLVFALANLALWRLKGQASPATLRFAVPRWVPALGCLASLSVVLIQLAIELY